MLTTDELIHGLKKKETIYDKVKGNIKSNLNEFSPKAKLLF